MSHIYTSADQLIGHTPLLELRRLAAEMATGARLLAKAECFNPAGSVKDRVALSMLEDAERSGRLRQSSVPSSASAISAEARKYALESGETAPALSRTASSRQRASSLYPAFTSPALCGSGASARKLPSPSSTATTGTAPV